MKRIVLAGVVCLVVFVSLWLIASSSADTEDVKTFAGQGKESKPLPGSQISLQQVISEPRFAFAAVCEASNKSNGEMREIGVISTVQKFNIVELLTPKGQQSGEINMAYRYFDISDRRERAIKKGERIIWLVSKRRPPSFPKHEGHKALADTPQNRKVVRETVIKFNKALELLVREAISLPIRDTRGPGKNDQNPTGLNFSQILGLAGQKADVKNFTKEHYLYERDVKILARKQKFWALCALLDHQNVDAKIWAVRGLKRMAAVGAVPALLAAAKSNNYFVTGSENATIHATFRRTLKQALQKITGLSLTPKGLKVTTYPKPSQPKIILSDNDPFYFREEVDFKKVEDWLQNKFLSKGTPLAAQPAKTDIDKKNFRIELSDQDAARPGLLPIGLYTTSEHPGAKWVYEHASKGLIPRGYNQLVGRMEGRYSNKDEFTVTDYTLEGNRITAHIQYIRARPEGNYKKAVYLLANIPQNLPPGQYEVVIELAEHVRFGNWYRIVAYEHLNCTFTVPAPSTTQAAKEWGEPVEGVQVRLRADKMVWKAGELPIVKADVRNTGRRDLYLPYCYFQAEVEVDGRSYRHTGPSNILRPDHGPYVRHREDIEIYLYLRCWTAVNNLRQELRLKPGRNTIQVAFYAEPDNGQRIRVLSNPVEIEIQAGGPAD